MSLLLCYQQGLPTHRKCTHIQEICAHGRNTQLTNGACCIDPKTQRICVPLNPENVWDFDPNDVPSLEDILRNMENHATANKDKDRSVSLHAHESAHAH